MSSTFKLSGFSIFVVFLTVNLIGSVVNHIDDTDETYGYWEPLHYLMFGDGMQTWEYAPQYAIRTYSFIYPVYLVADVLRRVVPDKITMFYLIRAIIGVFTAIGQTNFVVSIRKAVGPAESKLTMLFLLCSPGVFFSSTSYLPSVFTMTCVMNSSAAFLVNSYLLSVLWGCFAVLWSGWPFVAILFVPLGSFMLIETAMRKTNNSKAAVNIVGIITLIVQVISLLVVSLVPVVLIDHHYYRKWTSPPLNILLYNAIGGSGDELYGVEPASYYIRNLFLNTGLAWVLTLAAPFINAMEWATGPAAYFARFNMRSVTIASLAVVWLGILFSRPHKEERFMYPIYPILAFIASESLCSAGRFVDAVVNLFWKSTKKTDKIPRSRLTGLMFSVVALVAGALCVSRTTSNYINYRGFMGLWKRTHTITSMLSNERIPVNICTGSEWYLFPSHFFLPGNAHLQYIEDGFKGVLPQHFASVNGTSAEPVQPFNDRNQEERSRYVTAEACDYIILLVDHNKPREDQEGALRVQLAGFNDDAMSQQVVWFMSQQSQKYVIAAEERVISPEYSTSSLARAYYLPGYSDKRVKFKSYYLLKRVT